MSSSIVIGAFLVLGPIALVACVAVGLLGFNPDRARAIRNAESREPLIVEEVRRIHVRSPDRFRHDRLDRHPFYLGIAIAAWCYAWCIFSGATITGNLGVLSEGAKLVMAGSFVVGSTLILIGSALGLRVGKWTILRGIRDNLTSSMLSDDIRLPYTFGSCGLFAMGVSSAIYSWTSFGSTIASYGGWVTGAISVCATLLSGMFVTRIRRYGRARNVIVAEAIAQLECR